MSWLCGVCLFGAGMAVGVITVLVILTTYRVDYDE